MGKKTMTKKVQTHEQHQDNDFFEEASESPSQHRHQGSASATKHGQPQPKPIKNKKIAKSKRDPERQEQDDGGIEKVRNFQCKICEKKYGSPAATHTHINTKHPEHTKNKKRFIVNLNPTITVQTENKHIGIRMKDIEYPETEAGCMELSDLALYYIFEHAKEIYASNHERLDILISENDTDFNEDILSEEEEEETDKKVDNGIIQIEEDTEKKERRVDDGSIREVVTRERQPTKRELEIERFVKKWVVPVQITELTEKVKGYWQFKMFIERKFNLQLELELMKFFKPQFAAKVKIELELTAVLERVFNPNIIQITSVQSVHTDIKLLQKIKECEKRLWDQSEEPIKQDIKTYYRQWVAKTQQKVKKMVNSPKQGVKPQSKSCCPI